jgi:hypothetical protein
MVTSGFFYRTARPGLFSSRTAAVANRPCQAARCARARGRAAPAGDSDGRATAEGWVFRLRRGTLNRLAPGPA